MLKNYFKIAFRNLFRNKLSSFINIGGLVVGMTGVMLIAMYIREELKYDRFFLKADRIYQVNLNGNMGGQEWYASNTPPTVGPALARSIPAVETFTRTYQPGTIVVSNENPGGVKNQFTERKILAVDSNFLQVFDYKMLEGNAAGSLLQPNSIVLTETAARKYFGKQEALGKTLTLDQFKMPFIVSGILEDLPAQSTLRFDMLIPVAACGAVKQFSWSWVWCQMNTYVMLKENVATTPEAIKQVEATFPAVVKANAAQAFRRIGKPFDKFIADGGKWDFHLQPLTEVHLYSDEVQTSYLTLGSIRYVYIFATIAAFLIILACVNYMNLSTAHATKRTKEIGVRQALGSSRKQLRRQFLAESLLFSLAAVFISFALVILLLPWFNDLAGRSISLSDALNAGSLVFVACLWLLTGLLAGSYPAFYLTSFRPVEILKGIIRFRKNAGSMFVRNGLVVFQFTISVVLIICTLVVFMQLRYTQSKKMGLNKNNVLIIPGLEKMVAKSAFVEELNHVPGIGVATLSTGIPTGNTFTDSYTPEPGTAKEIVAEDISLSSFIADEQFIPTLQLELLQGRNFSKNFNDSLSVIVNEETVKATGWKDPVGMYMSYPGGNGQRFKVIGVVKDFDVQSVHNSMTPFALFHPSSQTYDINSWYALASVEPGRMDETIQSLEKKWKTFAPEVPFEYSFLDQQFEAMYFSEKRMAIVFGIFTMLSIAVGCLGLFGLSVFTAERRTKEIGIRKVLGAGSASIVASLSKVFIQLVVVSILIASPVAWFAMNKWLETFAYRINISWWMFVAAGLLVLFIALATVSFQAIKAALSNPVKILRTE